MKKLLLSVFAGICFGGSASAQYFYIPQSTGTNPGNLNQDVEYPEGGGIATGWTKIVSGPQSPSSWSSVQTIPFTFNFNGTDYTSFKVSSNGVLTFSTTATAVPADANTAIPSASIPDNSLVIWGMTSSNAGDNIFTKTFGTNGSRQHWIQFNSFTEAGLGTGYLYWSIVLEEGTNKIYFVDQRSSGTATTLTVGIQINGTTAVSVEGSPNLKLKSGADATPVDNYYYEFIPGNQAAIDLGAKSVSMPLDFALTQGGVDVAINVFNYGTTTVNNVTLSYSVDGGSTVTQNVTGLNIAKFATAKVTHPTKFTPSATGTYNFKIWLSDPNGSADENMMNDTITFSMKVWDDFVPRKSLHEVFTSSTCPPCKPGNEMLQSILDVKSQKFTVIKYQYNFPGTGDPYYTSEGAARGTFYGGINSVPRLQVDGQWNNNPNGYTAGIFDSYQTKPAFVKIEATQTLDQSAKGISINAKVTPLIDFPAGTYKLRVAVLERVTKNNVKNNGETEFHWVMKKMLPNATGYTFNMPTKGTMVEQNATYNFPGNYRLPNDGQTANIINLATEHSVEKFWDLIGVVFLQNETTKEVLQSEWTSPNWALSAQTINLTQVGLNVFPNPANNNFTISLDNSLNLGNYTITITDITGKQVYNQTMNMVNELVVDCNNFNNGLYMVNLSNGVSSTTTKLIISK